MDIELPHLAVIIKLFYLGQDGFFVLVVIKVVDDLQITGESSIVTNWIEPFKKSFKLETVVLVPYTMKFYGPEITHVNAFSTTIDGEEKFTAIECFPCHASVVAS